MLSLGVWTYFQLYVNVCVSKENGLRCLYCVICFSSMHIYLFVSVVDVLLELCKGCIGYQFDFFSYGTSQWALSTSTLLTVIISQCGCQVLTLNYPSHLRMIILHTYIVKWVNDSLKQQNNLKIFWGSCWGGSITITQIHMVMLPHPLKRSVIILQYCNFWYSSHSKLVIWFVTFDHNETRSSYDSKLVAKNIHYPKIRLQWWEPTVINFARPWCWSLALCHVYVRTLQISQNLTTRRMCHT